MRTKITQAERNVLNLIHLSNKEIAKKLVLALPTVKTHIHNLLLKFKVKNRTELILKVIKERKKNMLSINDINLLEGQNKKLKKQNETLQKVFFKILELCDEQADSIKVVEFQDRIRTIINGKNNR